MTKSKKATIKVAKTNPDVVILPNTSRVTKVQFSPSYVSLCLGGPYMGTAKITYEPDEHLIEFMSFEKWLRGQMAEMKATGEEACRFIFDEMTALVGEVPLTVEVSSYQLPGHEGHGDAVITIRRTM